MSERAQQKRDWRTKSKMLDSRESLEWGDYTIEMSLSDREGAHVARTSARD